MMWFYRDGQQLPDILPSLTTGVLAYTSRHLQHVGNQLSANGRSTLVLLILSRVRKIRDDSGNAPSGSGSTGVDHDEQLHEPVIDIPGRSRLQNKDVLVTDGLANGHAGLLV